MMDNKRPDRFPRYRNRIASLSMRRLRRTRVTTKPVRSADVNRIVMDQHQFPTGNGQDPATAVCVPGQGVPWQDWDGKE